MNVHSASMFRGASNCKVFAKKLKFRCKTRGLNYLAMPTTTKGAGQRVGFVASFKAAYLRVVPDCTAHLTRIVCRVNLSPHHSAGLRAIYVNTRPRSRRRHHQVRRLLNMGTCGYFKVSRVGNPNITFRYARRGKLRV